MFKLPALKIPTLTMTGFLALSGAAYGQYIGPSDVKTSPKSSYSPSNVAVIKANAKDEQKISLEGRITRKLDAEKYMFSDGTGEIRIEIDDDEFPKTPINAETKVKIEGEVDIHNSKNADIDVDRLTILK